MPKLVIELPEDLVSELGAMAVRFNTDLPTLIPHLLATWVDIDRAMRADRQERATRQVTGETPGPKDRRLRIRKER